MYADEAKTPTAPGRDPLSHEIMNYAERLAGRADAIAQRTQSKLQPVMMPAQPTIVVREGKVEQVYPPLFEDLRSRFRVIDNALTVIEDALSRTEI